MIARSETGGHVPPRCIVELGSALERSSQARREFGSGMLAPQTILRRT